jgi:acyl carrier protein
MLILVGIQEKMNIEISDEEIKNMLSLGDVGAFIALNRTVKDIN